MVKPIVHDTFFLSRKSREATAADVSIAQDLLDTLQAHREECVGMAANMIGQNVRIIAFHIGGAPMLMYNPVILKAEKPFETEEGCLSLKRLFDGTAAFRSDSAHEWSQSEWFFVFPSERDSPPLFQTVSQP